MINSDGPRQSLHFVTELLKFLSNSIGVGALEFDDIFVDRPTSTAGVFELLQESRVVIVGGGEASDDGHHAAVLAFLHGDFCGLLSRCQTNGFRLW